jgi:predicted RNase H-like HicB family nuclease
LNLEGIAMPKTPEQYLKEPYARILIPNNDGGFSAEVLEFPGCFADGDTAEEAFRRLEAAAKAWIEAALDQGQEIPEPSSNTGFSGKLALRLPRSLHRQAMRMAERDGTSLNQFLVTAVAARVGAEDLWQRLVSRLPFVSVQVVSNTAAAALRIHGATGKRILGAATADTKSPAFVRMPPILSSMGSR